MIPSSSRFDQETIAALVDADPLVKDYRAFFALFDWQVVHTSQARHSGLGRPGHRLSVYVKACLLRINQGLQTATQLRHFLVTHPFLVIDLGFRLVLDSSQPHGFDVERTVPCAFWWRKQLHDLDRGLLQSLLHATVQALQAEIPGLGETVAFDVKHIYAWVSENNPRVYVKGQFDVTHIPKGDPDCRLGVKKSTNQVQADGSKKVKKESLFGYGSGVAAATNPVYGDVVLAEYTLPFNEGDATYFRPLYQQTVLALDAYPTNVTGDAAFDAWYVYECAALHGGMGAVPLNQHDQPVYELDADGTPLCPIGLRMHAQFVFPHTRGYQAQRVRCPLIFPHRLDFTCSHAQFAKGRGCVKDVNIERGGRMRVTLDRRGPHYRAIYKQRTSCERINSQAQALGIERPKVRNIYSVRNLNTLIYLVINARALAKAQSKNKGILQMH